MINLQVKGRDPNPIWLTYKPALDVIKKMCADTKAAKSGFSVKPRLQTILVKRRDEHGNTVTEEVREWEHPSTAEWWHKMQAEVCVHNVHVPSAPSACPTIPLQLEYTMYVVVRKSMLIPEFRVQLRV